MTGFNIKLMTYEEIPSWISISAEYDIYVKELVNDLTHWYEGNEYDPSFVAYMNSKINQNEAYMAIDETNNTCEGIIAFSKKYNRITFFGISHLTDFASVASSLMEYALISIK